MKVPIQSLCLVIFILLVNNGGFAQKTKLRTKPKRLHSQVKSQCKNFKTHRMKQLCRRIAADPNVVAMGSQVRAYAKAKDEKNYISRMKTSARTVTVNWTPFTVAPVSPRIGSLPKAGFQCKPSCPSHKDISSGKTPKLRSTSPWQTCSHYDPLRFPQWLKLGFCSCKGCINPKTKKEDHSYVSQPITIDVTVLKRDPKLSFNECIVPKKGCVEIVQRITIGCTCMLPAKA